MNRSMTLFATAARIVTATAVFASTACKPRPDDAEASSEPSGPEVTLPKVSGIDPEMVGPVGESPGDAEKWLSVAVVTVPAEGKPVFARTSQVSQWRGVALPRDGVDPPPDQYPEDRAIRVRVAADGGLRVLKTKIGDIAALREAIQERRALMPEASVILDADSAARMSDVLPVLVSLLEIDGALKLNSPKVSELNALRSETSELVGLLRVAVEDATRDRHNLPTFCVRIRADADARYREVQGVLLAAVGAYIWRIGFVSMLDGREVEIGPIYTAPDPPELRVMPGMIPSSEDAITDIPVIGD